MKKKLMKFGLASFISMALLGAIGCSSINNEKINDIFKTEAAYRMEPNDAGTSYNLTKISYIESIDSTKLLLATGFDDETLSAANQRAKELKIEASLGYVINDTTYSGKTYYGAILTKNASSVEKVWTSSDIFGETNKNHLIVKEIDYVQTGRMTINAFIKVGEEVIAEANRSIDFNEYWEAETLASNWSWSGEIAPITNQPQGYLVEATNLSTTISNFVKIPSGAEYFKLSLLTYGGVAPKVTVYLNNSLVKAEGATEDYVTPAASNNTQIFAYDLGDLTGNISVDIKVESTETGSVCTAFFQSVGFSEFAYETTHVSNLTKWTKGRMCLDWTIVGTIAGNTIEGYGNGCYHLNSNGGFQNTVIITNETKYLSVIAGWQLTVTANGNTASCVDAGSTANRYVYDLSAYVGQNVVIRIFATAPDYGPFAQAELIKNI